MRGGDGGEAQEGEWVVAAVFPVRGEPSASVEPGNRALDQPALRQHHERCSSERLTIETAK